VAQLAGDFNSSSNYVASGLPKFRTLEEADFVINTGRTIDITALPDLSDDNIRVEVENCIAALSRLDMEVVVVDVMHPQLQVPSFYTIVPGAHFRERAAGTSVGMFSAKLIAEQGDFRKALAELQDVDALLPGKYYVKFYMGSCQLSLGDPVTALKYFEESLTLDPNREDRASIYSYMGLCLRDMGQYDRALGVLEKAAECDSERTDVYNLKGFCYFKLKDHEKAIRAFEEVLRLDPTSAIDYANIASNYRDMGKKDLAVEYYEHALKLDPSIAFAQENLQKLRD
jgi:ribosomal protein S12 methylthiotransferase accessory factor